MGRFLHFIGAHVARLSRFTEDEFGVAVMLCPDFWGCEGWRFGVEWDERRYAKPFEHRYDAALEVLFYRPIKRLPSPRRAAAFQFRLPVRAHFYRRKG